jgi:hypothetical protein
VPVLLVSQEHENKNTRTPTIAEALFHLIVSHSQADVTFRCRAAPEIAIGKYSQDLLVRGNQGQDIVGDQLTLTTQPDRARV